MGGEEIRGRVTREGLTERATHLISTQPHGSPGKEQCRQREQSSKAEEHRSKGTGDSHEAREQRRRVKEGN